MDLPPYRDANEAGQPRRSTLVPLTAPFVDRREAASVSAALDAGHIGTGPSTTEFEARFAELVSARHAVAVNSSWAGFHLVFEALGLTSGDEILLSAGAAREAMAAAAHVRATPILVDVLPGTLTLDVEHARRRVTSHTRAVVPAHFAGCPADMADILALATRHGLAVVEDGSQALTALYDSRPIGSIGQATVFALTQDLELTTGEGGIVTTDLTDLAEVCRTRRFYGIPVETLTARHVRPDAGDEHAVTHGFGYEMADVNATIGLEQLRKVQTFHAIRSYYAELYDLGLSDLPEVVLPVVPAGRQHAWTFYVIRLRRERLRISRDAFIARLAEEKVTAGVRFVPLYVHRYFRERFGLRPDDCPVSLAAYGDSVALPLYPGMSEADVWDVITAVRKVVSLNARR